MMRLGVTGGLGSGKSVVAQYFANLGGVLFDADVIAKDILLNSTEVLDEIVDAFGAKVLGADKQIDPAALGAIVFANEDYQQRVNAIIHPRVVAAAQERMDGAARAASNLFVLDAPLLFEAGLEQYLDKTLLVIADEEVRIQRALARGGLTEADIRRRIALQMPDEQKRRLADVVVDNNGTMAELTTNLDVVYKSLVGGE